MSHVRVDQSLLNGCRSPYTRSRPTRWALLALSLQMLGTTLACTRERSSSVDCVIGPATIFDDSLGFLPVHMKAVALRERCPNSRDSLGLVIDRSHREHWLLVPTHYGTVRAYLWPSQAGDTLVATYLIHDAGFRTPEGIGVGSTLADLRRKYGKPKLAFNEPNLLVDFDAKPALEFVLKWAPLGGWLDGDSVLPEGSVPDSARVSEVSLTGTRSILPEN